MQAIRLIFLAALLASCHVLAQDSDLDAITESGSFTDVDATLAQEMYASVDIWGMHLVTIRSYYRHFSPKQRADNILQRLQAIPTVKNYDVTFRKVSEEEYKGGWILVNDHRVVGLLEADAPPNMTLDAYAQVVNHRLIEWLKRRDAQQRPRLLLLGTLYTGLATLAFAAATYLLMRGRRRILSRLEQANNPRYGLQILHVGNVYLMPYIMMLLSGVVRLVMLATIGVISYLWLAFVMRQFPYTIGYGQRLTDYIVSVVADIGLGVLHAVPDLTMAVIIFWLAKMCNNAVHSIFLRIEQGRIKSTVFDPETAKATRRVIVVLVWLFAIVVAYPYIPGSDTEAFKGVSVFIGLIVSLGSAGIVSQLLGGLIVVYSRAFQPGEYVRIGEYEGVVTTVGVLSTKVRTVRKEEITIPNAVLLNASSTNFTRLSKPDGVIVNTTVTIGYDTPWQQVHQLLLNAGAKTPGVREQPEPHVRQIALSDWYVEYRLLVHIDTPEDRLIVLSDLHQHIQDEFSAAGVQIMSPHFVGQPEHPVVPPAKIDQVKGGSGE
ncbi:mechanosensitive ion channel family protein [Gilvimarinus sp. SDUM040013]|uniref:Small-conductance mechanosensitive channel n=1 Tax=Gilvimarinus gilvus TaxID=3058038 RepID=A0ABU4S2A3_9GAMM|nr:mechanosensitive ion channel family protein [Gilvimarinus sp. SDUM040013]MDO3385487.1 mechanosensitive ion channel family protein [Gilvimarinus sp. SDUM040013]MDX6851278.1 mechanosensitive ion channel family protein [Gilvimarinus sp. SDUM040013]